MPGIACSKDDCNYNSSSQIPAGSEVSAHITCLQIHTQAVHPPPVAGDGGLGARAKVEKVPRPQLKHGVGQDDFQFFQSRWEAYKRSCQLTTASDIRDQLVACCEPDLMMDLHKKKSNMPGLWLARLESGRQIITSKQFWTSHHQPISVR